MKKLLTNNVSLKLLSLLFAVIFWLIVVNIDDPEVSRTIQGISVTVLDEEVITGNNQVYNIVSGEEVTITVKGPRSEVDRMTKDDFVAEAPFSEKSNVDAVPIYVTFRNSKYEKDCEITQKTMSMRLEIENIVTKSYEIGINHTSNLTSAYYLGKENIEPKSVTISAPESVINQIENVMVDVDLSSHTEDF
jgi:YbbR domain-containing protein